MGHFDEVMNAHHLQFVGFIGRNLSAYPKRLVAHMPKQVSQLQKLTPDDNDDA